MGMRLHAACDRTPSLVKPWPYCHQSLWSNNWIVQMQGGEVICYDVLPDVRRACYRNPSQARSMPDTRTCLKAPLLPFNAAKVSLD